LGIFKRSRTTTVPFETPTRLVLSGPYRFTRNPMYVGLSLIYVGVAATQALLWPLVVLPLVLVYIDRVVIPVDKRLLHEVFGSYYVQIRRWVNRWLEYKGIINPKSRRNGEAFSIFGRVFESPP